MLNIFFYAQVLKSKLNPFENWIYISTLRSLFRNVCKHCVFITIINTLIHYYILIVWSISKNIWVLCYNWSKVRYNMKPVWKACNTRDYDLNCFLHIENNIYFQRPPPVTHNELKKEDNNRITAKIVVILFHSYQNEPFFM